MAETKFPKRRAFAMQKPRHTDRADAPKRTERQRAADKRRREEARALGGYAKGPKTPEKRMAPLAPGQVRITSLIVDELTRALGVSADSILRGDGTAPALEHVLGTLAGFSEEQLFHIDGILRQIAALTAKTE